MTTHVLVSVGLLTALATHTRVVAGLHLRRLEQAPADAQIAREYDEVRACADQAYVLAGLPSAAGWLPSVADLRGQVTK